MRQKQCACWVDGGRWLDCVSDMKVNDCPETYQAPGICQHDRSTCNIVCSGGRQFQNRSRPGVDSSEPEQARGRQFQTKVRPGVDNSRTGEGQGWTILEPEQARGGQFQNRSRPGWTILEPGGQGQKILEPKQARGRQFQDRSRPGVDNSRTGVDNSRTGVGQGQTNLEWLGLKKILSPVPYQVHIY